MEAAMLTKPPASAFELQEAFSAKPSPLREDGTVLIHVIRPGIGLGRGRHYYSPQMLQENAARFEGWNVYVDHLAPEARAALHGLPRSIRDIGGWIEEAYWDESIPAGPNPLGGMHEQGGVVGVLRPIREVRELIEEGAAKVLKFSIRAQATDVRPVLMEGAQAWDVVGISQDPPGSVDCVSEAGAGGQIMEAFQRLDDDRLQADERLLLEAHHHEVEPSPAEDTNNGPAAGEGDDSVEKLEEALRDPESPVARAVHELVEAKLSDATESARAEERETAKTQIEEARAEATAAGDRKLDLYKMRDKAHELIEAADLPEKMSGKLINEFSLNDDDEPTAKLDVRDEVDGDNKVVKPAMEILEARVASEIQEGKDLLADLDPTRVSGQGPSGDEGGNGEAGGEAGAADRQTGPEAAAQTSGDKPYWREHLEEAGVDVDAAYNLGGEAAAATAEKE